MLFFPAILVLISIGNQVYAQQGPITVEGRIINGTSESSNVSGLTVTFHQEGAVVHEHFDVVTDIEGNFRFDGIQYDQTLIYGVSLRYQGALYGNDIDLSDGQPSTPVELTIYDSSDDQEVIRAASASLLFADADQTTQTISALEIVQIVNDSDYTFVAGNDSPMNLLRFGLPPDSEGLQVDTRILGADIVQVDRGFALLASVPPGSHEIMYTYQFPYDGEQTSFTKSLPFGADHLRVLSPYEVLTLSSNDISGPESVSIGERPYQLMEASDLARGSRISVELTNLPKITFMDRFLHNVNLLRLELVAPAGLMLFMFVLAAFAIHRRRRQKNAVMEMAGSADASTVSQESQTLRQIIFDLEQDFSDGSVAEADYLRRRRVLEARLNSLSGS